METTPLKRSAQLAQLSREHHFGLLCAWKIKQGLWHNIALERIADYVDYFWNAVLADHFRTEESRLYKHAQHDLIERGLREHAGIKAQVALIRGKDKSYREAYFNLADLLTKHIRFEERELFPYLESVLSPEQLSGIANDPLLLHKRPVTDSYPDEFWITKRQQ
jgi:hemerythrin-like domain-containing protein